MTSLYWWRSCLFWDHRIWMYLNLNQLRSTFRVHCQQQQFLKGKSLHYLSYTMKCFWLCGASYLFCLSIVFLSFLVLSCLILRWNPCPFWMLGVIMLPAVKNKMCLNDRVKWEKIAKNYINSLLLVLHKFFTTISLDITQVKMKSPFRDLCITLFLVYCWRGILHWMRSITIRLYVLERKTINNFSLSF